MIVAIVTFNLAKPATLAEITKVFQGTAPKYQGMAGLLRKNYFLSEDGRHAGGIYVWASRADAERVYTPEWRQFVASKYGGAPAGGKFPFAGLGGQPRGSVHGPGEWGKEQT